MIVVYNGNVDNDSDSDSNCFVQRYNRLWQPRRRERKRNAIDSFLFLNEFDMVALRLLHLDASVYRFLAVEGAHSFQGAQRHNNQENSRQFVYSTLFEQQRHSSNALSSSTSVAQDAEHAKRMAEKRERLARRLFSKVTHRVVEWRSETFAKSYWGAEVFQRNSIGAVVEQWHRDGLIDDSDLLLLSDADEIPRRDDVDFLRSHDLCGGDNDNDDVVFVFQQRASYYGFAWRRDALWNGTVAASVGTVRRAYAFQTNEMRRAPLNVVLIGGEQQVAGWHCTFCMPLPEWHVKLRSYSHREVGDKRASTLLYARRSGRWLVNGRNEAAFDLNDLPPQLHHPLISYRLSYLLNMSL
jgi:Glycosyltransferase family 17